MAGTGPLDLYDLALEYLGACEAAVATTIGGAIPMAYVAASTPPWDWAPFLSVHVGGPVVGDTTPLQPPLQPLHREVITGTVRLVQLTATVLREEPYVDDLQNIPSVDDLQAVAQQVTSDVWAIWHYVSSQHQAGNLFPSLSGPPRREMILDPVVNIGNPALPYAGWQIPIRVQLDGYAP